MMKNVRVVNASGISLGRLSSTVAYILQGKNRVDHLQKNISHTIVVVKNMDKVAITKKKLKQKVYRRTSGYPGAVRELLLRDAMKKSPQEVLVRTVRGMLPSNKQRSRLLKNIRFE